MYNPFNPYQQMNMLQPQQITQVNGKASVESIQMPPNSSVLLMDTTAPIVWLCISDGVGKVKATPYDIKEHVEEVQPTVDNLEIIENRLERIEKTLEEMEKKANGKSNGGNSKSKSNIPDDSTT